MNVAWKFSGALTVRLKNSFGGFQMISMIEVFANMESLEGVTSLRYSKCTYQMAEENHLMELIQVIF